MDNKIIEELGLFTEEDIAEISAMDYSYEVEAASAAAGAAVGCAVTATFAA